MRLGYDRRRAAWLTTCLKQAKTLVAQERASRPELEARRRAELERLLAHARQRSPFYRGRIPAGPVELERIPVLEKAEMMARYDDVVTDRSLHGDELLGWLETRRRDEFYAGRYRVMTTSGSSGRKGLFVYDREGWAAIGGQFLRGSAWMGIRPRLPRCRLAMLTGASVSHIARRARPRSGSGSIGCSGCP
jgi:phenylacetate-CoA ligase